MGRVNRLAIRLILVTALLLAAVTAAYAASARLFPWLYTEAGDLGAGDPGLNPVERLFLQTYLSSHAEELKAPAGNGNLPVAFTVNPGETAQDIAANLASAGLLKDNTLFRRYVRYHGLDSRLEAGEHLLTPQMTIPELATSLGRALAQEVALRFVEGWRMEEMADYLSRTPAADIAAADFRAIVLRQVAFDLSRFDFLTSLPSDATLEGFLFPDTYRVPLDADAAYLVAAMLENFGQRVTPAMRQGFGAGGLTLRQAITLASIVEREAVVPEERGAIASVFYNRLAQSMKLEADPTVQYALGYQEESNSWWKAPLYREDLRLDSPYNTYVTDGLPPGPIANPSLSSLQAVADPAATEYMFFVADCYATVTGAHVFSRTFEEHLANVARCN